ncbi:SCO family protein [Sphingomonas crocodyli]|uniref:SCO family protein n=2 Tax=Sphingomonas crocodyli TaxID=1979270 RepID=A0A437M4F6_9SPHN|nr:SCO family protein [Sphingomonas crocodyli]
MAGAAMNKPYRNRFALIAIAAALALGGPIGCSGGSETPPLAGARIGGPFTLTDQDGKRVSDTAFAGKYRLVYFGYTFCPDICPTDLQKMGQGMRALEKEDAAAAAKIQPIFISIDPARDTPAVLKAYVPAFHPRLIGLTGTQAEIDAVAKEFAVFHAKVPTKDGSDNYLMNHSTQMVLFDPTGAPLALIPQDKSPEEMAAEMKRWVK